jgi:hypothetical protein
MSLPDAILLFVGADVPMRIPSHPHRAVLLPDGITATELGTAGHRTSALFLIDADCAHVTMSDLSFEQYLKSRTPILLCAQRARDLRAFFRRVDAFQKRGYALEMMP